MDPERYRAAEQGFWAFEGLAPTEHWVEAPSAGARTRVQVVGDGPPVLFVHGGSAAGANWAPLVGRLPGFRSLVLDRPGCGLSQPLTRPLPDVAALQAHADDLLVDVLDGLGVERAHLVSTSLGSYVGLRSVAAHPDRFDRVVALGFPIGAPNGPLPVAMRLTGIPKLGLLLTRLPANERMTRSMLKAAGLKQALAAGILPAEGVRWFQSLLNDTDTMRNELVGLPPLIRPLRGMDDGVLHDDALLGRITRPVRFVWGDGDPFGGPDVARAFAARVPGAELQVVPGGHAVWIDDPDGVAARVRDFLAT